MNDSVMAFIARVVSRSDVDGHSVIEVGAFDVNGSPRAIVESLRPSSYIGVDLAKGPGVDEVVMASDLIARFGRDSFDLVISTEMLEHVEDWRAAVINMKAIVKAGGVLIITTRSRGEKYHGYPHDYWRFELEDFRAIFGDFEIVDLESDPLQPGVFLKAIKSGSSEEAVDLTSLSVYSMPQWTRLSYRAKELMRPVVPVPARKFLRHLRHWHAL